MQVDVDVLGFLDPNITLNYIRDGHIVRKQTLKLPLYVKNVIKCRNPRCITTIEEGIDQVFKLCDPEKRRLPLHLLRAGVQYEAPS